MICHSKIKTKPIYSFSTIPTIKNFTTGLTMCDFPNHHYKIFFHMSHVCSNDTFLWQKKKKDGMHSQKFLSVLTHLLFVALLSNAHKSSTLPIIYLHKENTRSPYFSFFLTNLTLYYYHCNVYHNINLFLKTFTIKIWSVITAGGNKNYNSCQVEKIHSALNNQDLLDGLFYR